MTAPRAKDVLLQEVLILIQGKLIWTHLCFVQGTKNSMGWQIFMGCFVRGVKNGMGCYVL